MALDEEELEFGKTLAAHPELCCYPSSLVSCVTVLTSQAQRKQWATGHVQAICTWESEL